MRLNMTFDLSDTREMPDGRWFPIRVANLSLRAVDGQRLTLTMLHMDRDEVLFRITNGVRSIGRTALERPR